MISLSQHLNNLLEHYLEPMKRETFLSNAEINALFGNIHEIVTFQRQFLQNLEEALELEPEFNKFEHCGQFRVSLMATNRVNVCESVCVTRLPIENLSLSTLYMLISFFLPLLLLSPPQNVLFAIGSAFLYYVNHFKLYSSFCASHSKAQKVLHPSKYNSSTVN